MPRINEWQSRTGGQMIGTTTHTGHGTTLVRRLWHSPTLMTWCSYLTKSLTFFAVLPLVVTRLETPDIALWYLFNSVISLQLLADLGFSPTFVRVLSFARGGATSDRLKDFRSTRWTGSGETDWDVIEKICATMRVVYNRLTLLAVLMLSIMGTPIVARPISEATDVTAAWVAWVVILIGSTIILRGNTFSAYLQGLNKIALLRRWEAVTNLGAVITSLAVLLMGGGLLALVFANQAWMVGNIIRNWILCRNVEEGRFRSFKLRKVDEEVMRAVWPSAWRSGVGILMGQAPIQFTGLLFAQVGTPAGVASYLLSLNLLTAVRNFSMAPFYSKVPTLARLRAEGRIEEQARLAQRGMTIAYWSYVLPFVTLGLVTEPVLGLIGSNAEFAEPALWALLGLGMFIERFGAMHLHLYSTTNHIMWHVANGVTGVIFIVLCAVLFGAMGVYAFAVSYIASYLGFYAPYTAYHSYAALRTRYALFEPRVSMVPMVVMVIHAVVRLPWSFFAEHL